MTGGSFTTWNEVATEKKLTPTLQKRLDHQATDMIWLCVHTQISHGIAILSVRGGALMKSD